MDELARDLSRDLDTAFPRLVSRLGPRLFWGLRGMCGDHQEAEDLTQETFIRAYQAMKDFDKRRFSELRVEGWVWTIALNLGRNHLRDRARRPTPALLNEERAGRSPDPDEDPWDDRFRQLTRPQRTAVVLRHVSGMNIAEIAEVTGRPEGTVKADIHRGLQRLRQVMETER